MVGVSMIRSGLPDDLASDNSGSLRWLQSWFASVSISSELVSRHGFRDAPPETSRREIINGLSARLYVDDKLTVKRNIQIRLENIIRTPFGLI